MGNTRAPFCPFRTRITNDCRFARIRSHVACQRDACLTAGALFSRCFHQRPPEPAFVDTPVKRARQGNFRQLVNKRRATRICGGQSEELVAEPLSPICARHSTLMYDRTVAAEMRSQWLAIVSAREAFLHTASLHAWATEPDVPV